MFVVAGDTCLARFAKAEHYLTVVKQQVEKTISSEVSWRWVPLVWEVLTAS